MTGRGVGAGAVVAVALAGAPAAGEPRGAVVVGGELAVTGGGPVQRLHLDGMAFVTRRIGAYASVSRLALDGGSGLVTAGVAYRAAAARPRLELVVHFDAGAAWPAAPTVGGGVATVVWPSRWPVAVVVGVRGHLLVDGLADTRTAWSLTGGLALAR
ncbi:MAG: hypothetical protein R3B06_01395 [Kofleriaceae bacterium]